MEHDYTLHDLPFKPFKKAPPPAQEHAKDRDYADADECSALPPEGDDRGDCEEDGLAPAAPGGERHSSALPYILHAALLLGLLAFGYNEYCHYGAHWAQCNATFEVHREFAEEPVCMRSEAQRHIYEQHELLNCSRAEQYVISQPVGLCALRAWVHDTYAGRVLQNMSGKIDAVTAPYLLLVLLAATVIVGVRTYLTERGKSDRKALEIERYTEMCDRLMELGGGSGGAHADGEGRAVKRKRARWAALPGGDGPRVEPYD
jgi:hypothetical protein